MSNTVDAAYNGTLDNFPAVVNFVHEISSAFYQFTGYNALQAAAMHGCGHDHTKQMMKLVYFVKVTIKNESIGADLLRKYTELNERFPKNIRLIIYKQCVSIRNVYSNEFVQLWHVIIGNKSEIAVFSWALEDAVHSHVPESFWSFEVSHENDTLFFQIRNDEYKNNPAICPSLNFFYSHCQKKQCLFQKPCIKMASRTS